MHIINICSYSEYFDDQQSKCKPCDQEQYSTLFGTHCQMCDQRFIKNNQTNAFKFICDNSQNFPEFKTQIDFEVKLIESGNSIYVYAGVTLLVLCLLMVLMGVLLSFRNKLTCCSNNSCRRCCRRVNRRLGGSAESRYLD